MEIRQLHLVARAKSFERTCRFYDHTLALPRLRDQERDGVRTAHFQAGSGVIEVVGRAEGARSSALDEAFEYQGPDHKLVVVLTVASAEGAYQECLFRDKNVPGGLRRDAGGALIFETHDPDGVKIVFRQSE